MLTESRKVKLNLCARENESVWLHHPLIGDPSFDAFERHACNPAYVGEPPYAWPVNASLYRDSKTGNRFCYVSLYPETYIAEDGTLFGPGKTLLLRSKDEGGSWENLGIVLEGDKTKFDGDGIRPGTALDAMVVEANGRYHMLYCWAHATERRKIGLAYASADKPEGPFVRDEQPMVTPIEPPLGPGDFRDVYEGTLIRRQRDWLILSCIRQIHQPIECLNWSGYNQALIAMTAPNPQGPWSHPVLLISPQMPCWQPQPIENGVHWVHDGFVYVSQYSVASNRSYHALYRAPVERAHEPEAWEPFQNGSIFHAEPLDWEAMGVWGQPIHGYVNDRGRLEVFYPAMDLRNRGTINFAGCDWSHMQRDGFWLSGTTAPSLGLVQKGFSDFQLTVDLTAHFVADGGDWALVWNQTAALGPEPESPGALHNVNVRQLAEKALAECSLLKIKGNQWAFEENGHLRAQGSMPHSHALTLEQRGNQILLNGTPIAETSLTGGPIGFLADKFTYLEVRKFDLSGTPLEDHFIRLSALEGLWGAANNIRLWQPQTVGFLSTPGYVSGFEEARAKWNFHGSRARLFLPHGPQFGEAEVWLDGALQQILTLYAENETPSSLVWESEPLVSGLHAVMLLRKSGKLPVDQFEYI